MAKKPEWRTEHYFKLNNILTKAREDAKNFDRADPDSINNPYWREVKRCARMMVLLENFLEFDIYDNGGGTVIIKDKYILSLRNKRYRIKGKGEWYTYRKDDKLFKTIREDVVAGERLHEQSNTK